MKSRNDFFVSVFVEWIEVVSDCTTEEDCILRDDSESGSKVIETKGSDINVVDLDGSLGKLDESKES